MLRLRLVATQRSAISSSAINIASQG